MLRALDIVVGIKLICQPGLGQVKTATQLGLHQSQVSNSIKLLLDRQLFWGSKKKLEPNFYAWEELLPILKYFYPANMGSITVGMPTSYAAPPLNTIMQAGNDPVPVWPCGHAKTKGLRVEPLHPNIPEALIQYPDQDFYEILTLVDALRIGSARDKEYGKKLLLEKFAIFEKERM